MRLMDDSPAAWQTLRAWGWEPTARGLWRERGTLGTECPMKAAL